MEHIITDDDLQLLKDNYALYKTATKSGFVKNYSAESYKTLIYLYEKYINKDHSFTHWCGDCRFELVLRLYRWAEDQQNFILFQQEAGEKKLKIDVADIEPDTIYNAEVTLAPDGEIQEPKKRGRKPKNKNI